MHSPQDIRDRLNAAATEYLAAADKSRAAVLEQIPDQIYLIGMCLNRLADMVKTNGYLDNRNRIHRLTPEEIRKIVMTLDTAFKLQSSIVALPVGFTSLTNYIPTNTAIEIPINIGSDLPPMMETIDEPTQAQPDSTPHQEAAHQPASTPSSTELVVVRPLRPNPFS